MNLRHRHGLLLTRPAVSFRGGMYIGHERAAEIEPREMPVTVNSSCVINLVDS